MPWSTMEVSCYGQQWIGHVALYVPQLCIILLFDRRLDWYGLTHIWSHAASYSACIQFSVLLPNVRPGSSFRWLQLQRCGELTGVCVAAMSHWVAHCLKSLSFGSIQLQSDLVGVYLEPWLAVVQWWGWWSRNKVGSPEDYVVQVKMERVTANLPLQFKLNPAGYSCTVYSCRWFQHSRNLQ